MLKFVVDCNLEEFKRYYRSLADLHSYFESNTQLRSHFYHSPYKALISSATNQSLPQCLEGLE